jgi:hypothetical protein
LKAAKAIFTRLPEGHPFRSNPHLGDHEVSDAGFYDLLLHSQDGPSPSPSWTARCVLRGWR